MTIKDLLLNELTQIYPDMKDYLRDRYATKYTKGVLAEIKQSMLRPDNELEELSFNSTAMRESCGRIKYNQQEVYLFEFMSRSPKTSLVIKTFRGNLNKMSRVKLNPIYKDMIVEELMTTPPAELSAKDRAELEANFNKVIKIDITSLNGFIAKTRESISNTPTGSAMHNTLTENYHQATRLLAEVDNIDGIDFVKEYWVTADSGRQYGKFLSLQRMDKNVRHAALGVCHKYDFQAHSFAVMASIAKEIDPTLKIAAIEDYVRRRDTIRKQLAQDVNVPESVIKTVFTSLGFGAKPIANPFNAIRKAFYGDEQYNKFVNNQTFQFIKEDLDKINNTILNTFTSEDFTGMNGFTFTGRDPETNRKKSNSKRLAWIYQNAESYITQRLVELIKEKTGMDPMMTVHDCVYYEKKIPVSALHDVQDTLRAEFQYIKLEHEAIFPITTQAVFESRFEEYDREEQLHKQRIREDELLARGFAIQDIETGKLQPKQFTEIDQMKFRLEMQRIAELPDYEYEYEYEYEYNGDE